MDKPSAGGAAAGPPAAAAESGLGLWVRMKVCAVSWRHSSGGRHRQAALWPAGMLPHTRREAAASFAHNKVLSA